MLSYVDVVCSSVTIITAVVAMQTLMFFGMTDMACCGHKPFAPRVSWVVGEAYLFIACIACHDHWSSCGAEVACCSSICRFVSHEMGGMMVVFVGYVRNSHIVAMPV